MLAAIRRFVECHLTPAGTVARSGDAFHPVQIAAAALLVEVIGIDRDINEAERASILASVGDKFGLTPDEARELTSLAAEEARDATDYFQFTSEINRLFTPEQKVALIEHMWRAALADGVLHDHEQHLVRKIADLIHVAHGDFIAAKRRARGTA
ncbi:MAG: TerB family tellurite resistance protein [Burkholderiales bacterium]